MHSNRSIKHLAVVMAVMAAVLAGGSGLGIRAQTSKDLPWKNRVRITQADREAAAARAQAARAAARSASAAPLAAVVPPGGVPDYFGSANWAYSPALRKFVDTLPLLGPTGANNLLQYIPVAVPDSATYPLADYYEICLVQYTQQMHSDLPPTTLRGYVQLETSVVKGNHYPLRYPDGSPIRDANNVQLFAVDQPRYLGPLIVAVKDRAVRIKFINKLPTGSGGDLFVPVDTTVMGAGTGPNGPLVNYTQNRADLHLHGGKSPWISDGTPHQWITPAGESTPYPRGDSAENVPDMSNPGDGATTYYYSNQQAARLMFYHDHAYGITRLNVYAGEAAGYLLTDATEQELIGTGGVLAGLGVGVPLIIQDKTFVDAATVRTTDPTWNWGTGTPDGGGVRPPVSGDLWYPHVYSPAQNPYDIAGINPFGRWHYGPWFWPPTTGITHPPVDNPYYDAVLAPYPKIPGTPNPSIPGESFQDTALVNGTAFPTLTVEPKTYRFRILNAANDRFVNLQLYKADTTVAPGCPTCAANTEVKMVPASETSGLPDDWPTDGRAGGVPDPLTLGPDWIQIGTEGGFLPAPVVIPSRPIAWNSDQTTFNYGNVSDHSLLLAPAERADVVVDFSAFAGQTLILYNDAPAAFPALDPRYDYYTGAPDMTSTGGHSGPQVGRGPNTRTIMQIKVLGTAPAPAFNLTALQNAFKSTASTQGVFAKSQDPIIVGQSAYDSAYNTTFPAAWPNWGLANIYSTTLNFQTVAGPVVTDFPLKPKAIHDEMGAAFDSEYGRMSGKLGLELPNTNALTQNFVLQNFVDPPTEVIADTPDTTVPIGTLGDGTQIWKITHNGVDTHPIHFHLFDVQLLNRVGWDGFIRLPDANELGWKETIRVSPLEDTIVALRATAPKLPFGIPNSTRPLSPSVPIGATEGFTSIDPNTGQPITPAVTNQFFDFGWEYVWHCHILSHEEDDMMRPVKFLVATTAPAAPTTLTGATSANQVRLRWSDATPPSSSFGNPGNEIGYKIMRSDNAGPSVAVGLALANATSYTDVVTGGAQYSYQIVAYNVSGDSPPSNAFTVGVPPGVGSDKLVVNFGTGKGLFQYNGTVWGSLSGWVPEKEAEWTGGLAVDFGANGLFNYASGTWTVLSGWDPQDITRWGNGLVVNFGAGKGLFLYNGTWVALSSWVPEGFVEWLGGLAVDFGAGKGLFNHNGVTWSQLSAWDPQNLAKWGPSLAANFGAGKGLFLYNGSSWASLTSWVPENMYEWAGGLAVDFGAAQGLYNFNGTSWAQLTSWDALTVSQAGPNLVVNFGAGKGIFLYNNSSWSALSSWVPDGMAEWAGGLALDFGPGKGLFNLSGTAWGFLTSWDPVALLGAAF